MKERQVTAVNDPLLVITYHSVALVATINCCRLIDKVLRLRRHILGAHHAATWQSRSLYFCYDLEEKMREFLLRYQDFAWGLYPKRAQIGDRRKSQLNETALDLSRFSMIISTVKHFIILLDMLDRERKTPWCADIDLRNLSDKRCDLFWA